ncbi:MAG: metal-sensing transcriptional repressor [Alphaproteobacteria bacterium]
MSGQSLHAHHENIGRRLKRAEGHLCSIIKMIEEERACVDIAQQLYAVEKAIAQAKKTLIQDHIDHCLDHALEKPGRHRGQALDAFKQITKYL